MCILCTLLLRGWGAGKGGTDNALWSGVQLRAAWEKGGGDYFEWMFFRQGKEENPRRRRAQCGRDHSKRRTFLLSLCISLILSFCFFSSPMWNLPPPFPKVKAMLFLLWRLSTCPLLRCYVWISPSVLFVYGAFPSPSCPGFNVFQFEWFSSSFLCYIECTFY